MEVKEAVLAWLLDTGPFAVPFVPSALFQGKLNWPEIKRRRMW